MTAKEIDVEKHVLVPKHSKLSDKEKEDLLLKYNIIETSLPKILKIDPAIKKLDVKAGDVVRIDRESATAGKTVYYRLVV